MTVLEKEEIGEERVVAPDDLLETGEAAGTGNLVEIELFQDLLDIGDIDLVRPQQGDMGSAFRAVALIPGKQVVAVGFPVLLDLDRADHALDGLAASRLQVRPVLQSQLDLGDLPVQALVTLFAAQVT